MRPLQKPAWEGRQWANYNYGQKLYAHREHNSARRRRNLPPLDFPEGKFIYKDVVQKAFNSLDLKEVKFPFSVKNLLLKHYTRDHRMRNKGPKLTPKLRKPEIEHHLPAPVKTYVSLLQGHERAGRIERMRKHLQQRRKSKPHHRRN